MNNSLSERIAIIGTACHFPGPNDNPSQLADFIQHPHDVLDDVPRDRLKLSRFQHQDPNRHGSTNVQKAYMLSRDTSLFDDSFFQMNSGEAQAADPQQRMLLETVFEAIESAGYSLSSIAGSKTSMYVGCMSADYYDMQLLDLETMPKHSKSAFQFCSVIICALLRIGSLSCWTLRLRLS